MRGCENCERVWEECECEPIPRRETATLRMERDAFLSVMRMIASQDYLIASNLMQIRDILELYGYGPTGGFPTRQKTADIHNAVYSPNNWRAREEALATAENDLKKAIDAQVPFTLFGDNGEQLGVKLARFISAPCPICEKDVEDCRCDCEDDE